MKDKDKIKHKYGYVRVSSKSQKDNSSIESQKKELIENGVEEKNIRVEVADIGAKGTTVLIFCTHTWK